MISPEQRTDTTSTRREAAPPRAAALALVLAGQLAGLLHPLGTASIAHADAGGVVTSTTTVARQERVGLRGPGGPISVHVSDEAVAARWNALISTAHDTTASKSRPAMREPRDLAIFENPKVSRRAQWFLWATSAVAVGAVIAVFAQPHRVEHSRRPDLPAFPDAP